MTTSNVPTSLLLRFVFGVNSQVTNNGSFADTDENIIYVAGHSIVFYSRLEKRQRFINAPEITETITSFAVSPARRLVAISEKGDKPTIHIFDMKTFRRKKIFSAIDIQSKEFVCMDFSGDDQLLLTLTGHPDWTLMCWNWSKAKLVASVHVSLANNMPFYKCSFNPVDLSVCCAIGKDSVKFFRIADKDMRPLQEHYIPDCNFICHCWMRSPPDHFVAGTDKGALHLFRAGEHIFRLPCSPDIEYPITSLISNNTGFVAGSRKGALLVFTYDDVRDLALFDSQFKLINILEIPDASNHTNPHLTQGNVCNLFMDNKEEVMFIMTTDSQILYVPLVNPPLAKLQPENYHHAITAFHGPRTITGMDVCIRKPIILTCCKDGHLLIWNFQTFDVELQKFFHPVGEEMFSVALHPTGLHCAIGFADKLRIYHILVDDLKLCLEIPIKACKECRFSKGGHVLAAANGNSISIYDFYRAEKIADLRGHNSKVRSLHWQDNGCQLLSCGADGAVYVWDLDGAKRSGEFLQKGTNYTSVVSGGDAVFVVGSDRNLRQLMLPDLSPVKTQDANLILSNIALSVAKSVLFAGTGDPTRPGFIRAYSYPLSGDFDEYGATSTSVARLRLTPDENFLVVADDMGCLAIYDLKDRQDRYQRTNPAVASDLLMLETWSDEIIVTRGELDEKATSIAELKTKVEELKMHNEYQLKLKEMNYAEKIKEVTDKFVQELEQAKTKLELLQEERNDAELEYSEKLKQLEDEHQHRLQETETSFQAQIMELVENYQQLTRERDAQIERLQEQRKQLVASHERYVEELTADYERRLEEDQQIRMQLDEEKSNMSRELEEVQYQLEDDLDTEIENLRRHYEERLTASRETTLKYKGENGIMAKKFSVMKRDLEDQREEMKALQEREKELSEQIRTLEKEVSAHKKEIKSRDASIGEKEKKIYELKKKNQELDKFKFVLDFKIRELKMQIEPRQMEILAMRDQIKDMDLELEKYHKTNASLDEMIGVLRTRIDHMQSETKEKRIHAKQLENSVTNFRSDVQLTIQHIQNPPKLREAIEKLILTHGSESEIRPHIDPEVEGEYLRHKEFLERSIHQLKKSLNDSVKAHTSSNNLLMQENMSLINEINKQRESNKLLKMHLHADIGRIRHLATSGTNKHSSSSSKRDIDTPIPFPEDVLSRDKTHPLSSGGFSKLGPSEVLDLDPVDILEKNRLRIQALRAAIAELERRSTLSKAYSKEVLPPMEGVTSRASFSSRSEAGGANLDSNASSRSELTASASKPSLSHSQEGESSRGSLLSGGEGSSSRISLPKIV